MFAQEALLCCVLLLHGLNSGCHGCIRCRGGNIEIIHRHIPNTDSSLPGHGRPDPPSPRSGHGEMSKMSVQQTWITDGTGRVRLFRGFNAVEKQFPWYPDYLLNDTRLRLYREWGFNVVRLGTMWTGLEPERGVFNETYVSVLRDIVTKLRQNGMYVILDMHQDILSSRFGSYDGIPLWVMDMFPPSPHPFPWPLPPKLMMWTDGYLSQAVGRIFQQLYDNYNGTLDLLGRFWSKVAMTFKDSSTFDNVLGYELMNEPWAGDIYTQPSLLLPGVAGMDNLMPVYEKLNAAIRRHDRTSLLFYEPVTWGVVFNGREFGTGFQNVPGGATFTNRSVLSFHYYCWLMDPGHSHAPPPLLQHVLCDDIVGPQVFKAVSADLNQTGGSSFLTEFGRCDPDGNRNSSSTIECSFVMDTADRYLTSWTYWDSNFFYDNGSVDWGLTQTFVRPYARAISGIPLYMVYDSVTKTFQLEYSVNGSTQGATEIFVPLLHYPDGIEVVADGKVSWVYYHSEQMLYVRWEGDRNAVLTIVSVSIKPQTLS